MTVMFTTIQNIHSDQFEAIGRREKAGKILCRHQDTATLWTRLYTKSAVGHSVPIENAPSLLLSVELQEIHYASNVCSWSAGSAGYTEVNWFNLMAYLQTVSLLGLGFELFLCVLQNQDTVADADFKQEILQEPLMGTSWSFFERSMIKWTLINLGHN